MDAKPQLNSKRFRLRKEKDDDIREYLGNVESNEADAIREAIRFRMNLGLELIRIASDNAEILDLVREMRERMDNWRPAATTETGAVSEVKKPKGIKINLAGVPATKRKKK